MTTLTEPAAQVGQLPSLWELIVSGGPLMWPIGLCSVIAVAYAVERWLRLRRRYLGRENFARSLLDTLGSGGPEPALALCRTEPTPLARIMSTALESARSSRPEREKRVEDVATGEVRKMSANLRPLMIVYIVAPLLGLLGTVWGMIIAFATIAMKEGLGKPELLAAGVYQALVTTAAGLTIAIPTVVVYYYLRGKVEAFARRTEALYQQVDQRLPAGEAAHANS